MQHCIYLVRCEECIKRKRIQQIRMFKTGPFVNGASVSVDEVIADNDIVAVIEQMPDSMGTDIAGTTHNKNSCHPCFLFLFPAVLRSLVLPFSLAAYTEIGKSAPGHG